MTSERAGTSDQEAQAVTGRRSLVALAGHTGDVATAHAALEDPEPVVRATALGALVRLGRLDPEAVARAGADPDRRVRARAAELAVAAGPGAAATVLSLLHDREASVVEAACFGLGELGPALDGDDEVVAGLAAVAGSHPDALCREAAVAAVGAIGAEGGLATVIAALADKPAVRRRAVVALAAFDGPEVTAALERSLADRDWQVRQAAEDLLGRRSTS